MSPEKKVNLVFTMAGRYTRFVDFSSRIPKYLLPLGAGTVFSYILDGFLKSGMLLNCYFIANESDKLFYPLVRRLLSGRQIPTSNIIYIPNTRSQLETASVIFDHLGPTEMSLPIAFTNIDTIIFNRESFFQSLNALSPDQGLVDGFKATSQHYSYIQLGSHGNIVAIQDRVRIGDWACSGLYGFGSASSIEGVSATLLAARSSANFSDLYNFLISEKRLIKINLAEAQSDTCVTGTPEEYLTSLHRF